MNIEEHFDDVIISGTPDPEVVKEIEQLKESDIQEEEELTDSPRLEIWAAFESREEKCPWGGLGPRGHRFYKC